MQDLQICESNDEQQLIIQIDEVLDFGTVSAPQEPPVDALVLSFAIQNRMSDHFADRIRFDRRKEIMGLINDRCQALFLNDVEILNHRLNAQDYMYVLRCDVQFDVIPWKVKDHFGFRVRYVYHPIPALESNLPKAEWIAFYQRVCQERAVYCKAITSLLKDVMRIHADCFIHLPIC